MKFNKIMMAGLALCAGLAFTSCQEEPLDPNPMAGSDVKIASIGPSMLERMDTMQIFGVKLDKVSKVIFPAVEVEKANFVSASESLIEVVIPDDARPGKIGVLVGSDTIWSKTPMVFSEPIEIKEVLPGGMIMPGSEITIKGEYVYNIASITFKEGQLVNAADFVKCERHEVVAKVPMGAISGEAVFSDGADWTQKVNFEIAAASYTSMSATSLEYGDELVITGANFNLINKVTFAGNVEAEEFVVSDDAKTIKVNVPADATPGVITLTQFSLLNLETDTLVLPVISVADVTPKVDVRVGDEIVITGTNLDHVKSLTVGGEVVVTDYTVSADATTITFAAPEGMKSGKFLLVQNANISVETPNVKIWKPASNEEVLWEGDAALNWNNPVTVAYSDLQENLGRTLCITYYSTPADYHMIRMINSTWGWNPDGAAEWNLNFGDNEADVWEKEITQELLDNLAGLDLCLTGFGCNVTKVHVVKPAAGEVLWEGDAEVNWNNAVTLANSDIADNVGKTLMISYTCGAADYHMIRMINADWSWNPDGDTNWNLNFGDNETDVWEKEITAELVTNLAGKDFSLTGANCHITKVEVQ